jgi:hypothetical protein
MMNTSLPTLPERTLRKAELADLVALLEAQHRQKIDLVAPLSSIRYNGGQMEIGALDPVIDESGVTDVNGLYRPTRTTDSQLGDQFGIPLRYMDKMRTEHVALLDTNINEWAARAPEGKNVLIRMIYGSDERYPGTSGIVRAVKSDRYGIRDNLDTVLAVLDGMREAGLEATNFAGADITDDRMWFRISAPEIFVSAPELLEGYRDPRTGRTSRSVGDVVYAGVRVENSETGWASLKVIPEITVLACTNGMTINKAAHRQVHMGARMDEGSIQWSQRTQEVANELTKNQVKDAIASFMTTDFLTSAVAEITQTAITELTSPEKAIEVVAKKLSYSDTEKDGILAHFIKGGQLTAGGILQAVTSFAQDITDVTRANEFGATGIEAMELAAASVR